MIDRGQADDKIIAVLKDDPAYGDWSDIYQCPPTLLERLRHYFLTYKEVPGESGGLVEIAEVYGRRAAHDVIDRSREDYAERFGLDGRWLDIGAVLEQAFQDVHRLPDTEGDPVAEQRDGGARDVVGEPP